MKPQESKWRDPVKDVPAKPETLAVKGDFGKFTDLMRIVAKVRPPREAKPTSASPGPAAS